MVKIFSPFIFLALLALGCSKIPDNDNWLIVQGFLIVNEPVQLRIMKQDGSAPDIKRAYLMEGVIEHELVTNPGSIIWTTASDMLPQAGSLYELVVETPERRISAWVNMPTQITLVSSSAPSFTIDPASEGTPIFSLNWVVQDGESRILKLESLEPSEPEIPFLVPSDRFLITNGAPNTTSGAVLLDTDFLRYGLHRLTVYGFPEEYEEAYFYQPSSENGPIDEGPDNVINGSGFLIGVSQEVLTLDILQ